MKLFTFNIDENLHTRFKVCCAANKDEMTEVILEAIRDYVNMYPELWPAGTSEDSNSLEME